MTWFAIARSAAPFVVAAILWWRYDTALDNERAAQERITLLEEQATGYVAAIESLQSHIVEEWQANEQKQRDIRALAQRLQAAQAERDALAEADPVVRDWAAQPLPDGVYARRLRRHAELTGATETHQDRAAPGGHGAGGVPAGAGP